MIDINHLEAVVHERLRESLARYTFTVPSGSTVEGFVTAIAQDISPQIADYLHGQGVDIDWTDRSRYGEGTQG